MAKKKKKPSKRTRAATRRVAVPPSAQAEVEWESNRRCCVCRRRGTQLHHVDGNPANNRFTNLCLLCLNCHDEATRTGGLTRKLTPATIRRFRTAWYVTVRDMRKAHQGSRSPRRGPQRGSQTPAPPPPPVDVEQLRTAVVEGNAIHAIRRIGVAVSRTDWPQIDPLLHELATFGDTTEYGPAVGREYLEVVRDLVGRARRGDPHVVGAVAETIDDVAARVLPIYSLVGGGYSPSAEEIAVIQTGAEIGGDLAYDGAKYLRELRVVAAGAELMWRVLRFAHLNDLADLERSALEAFRLAEDGARHAQGGEFRHALEWLDYRRRDALADPRGEPVPIPEPPDMELARLRQP